ncbi:DUF397 domain-containing protein [Actinomadura sp. WMMB 499]|uniref:DUF397 domain-containing protein n=1 Tax=Actinomadura sp. WMMB 499 TaxID=1219491 RepID=UPI0012455CFA|nr:DUF397 domain-containing protein [Actinomadura sp. WMMB 499]QFG21211.1 DUF397 domain-containing protein [Actinomadura sp. WMMB 499]GGV30646.1 DUF397 domain-containing protein [Actinomadura cremea]
MTNLQRDLTGAAWRKSSHSGSGDQCVEVAPLPRDLRAVRDSKDPGGPALVLTPAAFEALLTTAREA